jgi:hypothetical protein
MNPFPATPSSENSDCNGKLRSASALLRIFCPAVLLLVSSTVLQGSNLDIVGVTLLRQFDPALQGNGIRVAQVEASTTNVPPPFEVNPATVGQPTSLFTYLSSYGTSSTFPNAVGAESGHADAVGNNLYGTSQGVAPQVSHVDNYDANYFYSSIVSPASMPTISARIVNQSFIFNQSTTVEQDYDDYATKRNTLFISGAGYNADQVHPAATAYNGLGVGVSDDANPPFGPTPDGRCKPDIIAPGTVASYATPYVAGSAAVLLQAALRGDGGSNLSAATNFLTLKALLLNGAIKPAGWTNSPTVPLDYRKGAGVVNGFNSWMQLKGGKRASIESTSVSTNAPHPPGSNLNNEPVLVGWDYSGITNTASTDRINHYYFNLSGTNTYTLTATLVWNRQQTQTAINDLNLFLYDTASGNPVAFSISTVDNVEHLWLPQLNPGRYDLQVLKHGTANQVSNNESYALAFEMFSMQLNIAPTNDSVIITWPVAPAGFTLQSTESLTPPVTWSPVNASVSVNTNISQNAVIIPMTSSNRFFRLQRP